MVVSQGDLFWVDLGEPVGSRPGFRRPFVVVQNDLFNRSRLSTVIVCAVTSNLRRAEAPGNVLLPKGAGNLTSNLHGRQGGAAQGRGPGNVLLPKGAGAR